MSTNEAGAAGNEGCGHICKYSKEMGDGSWETGVNRRNRIRNDSNSAHPSPNSYLPSNPYLSAMLKLGEGFTPRWIVLSIDIGIVFVALVISYLLRFDFTLP